MRELQKLLSVDGTANKELVVPSEVLVPFKDKGFLEYKIVLSLQHRGLISSQHSQSITPVFGKHDTKYNFCLAPSLK